MANQPRRVYDRGADLFAKDDGIRRASLVFSSGEQVALDLEDARRRQEFALARAPGPSIETTSVRMIVEVVYPGSGTTTRAWRRSRYEE